MAFFFAKVIYIFLEDYATSFSFPLDFGTSFLKVFFGDL
jgi:hypothetical protein